MGEFIHSLEETWLGIVSRSFAARAAAVGWKPDDPGSYCGGCGASVGPHECGLDERGPCCSDCGGERRAWDRLLRLGEYDGLLRDAVHDLKFTGWRRTGRELGKAMGQILKSELIRAGVDPKEAVIVPVPASFRRRMARGIDHTLVLARAMSGATGVPIARALGRRHRPSQLEVPRSSRRANVARAFFPRRTAALGGRVVILVDDVVTTGATMSAACRAVRAGVRRRQGTVPREIWGACVAVAVEHGTKSGEAKRGEGDLGLRIQGDLETRTF